MLKMSPIDRKQYLYEIIVLSDEASLKKNTFTNTYISQITKLILYDLTWLPVGLI